LASRLLLCVLMILLGGLAAMWSPLGRAQDWPAIARELESMFEADQAVRREWNTLASVEKPSDMKSGSGVKGGSGPKSDADADETRRAALRARVQAMDAAHQARLEAIIAAHGWPRRADVGGRATMAAFVILQHASLDFQRKVFADVQRAAANDEIDRSALAALDDRIRVHEKRPQRYGTQVEIRNGGVTLWPVEDAVRLDDRRREVGLMPICRYLALFATQNAKVDYPPCAARMSDPSASQAPTK
jgi:hypothetical protein